MNTHMDVFFARPYHSWERGTNENTNGLIRRLYPKKSSFAGIDEAELKRIDRFLNDPSPHEIFLDSPRSVWHFTCNQIGIHEDVPAR